jgi:hypothetical protein
MRNKEYHKIPPTRPKAKHLYAPMIESLSTIIFHESNIEDMYCPLLERILGCFDYGSF